MDDDFGGGVKGGVFPFLSVLICTMGVMILLLVVGSLNATMAGAETKETVRADFETVAEEVNAKKAVLARIEADIESIEGAQTKAEDLTAKAEEAESEAGLLADQVGKRTEELQQVQGTVGALSSKARAADAETSKIQSFRESRNAEKDLATARARRDASTQKLAGIQVRKDGLEKVVAALTAEHQELTAKLESPEAEFSISGKGADRPCVVLDVHEDHVLVVRSDIESVKAGTRVTRAKAVGADGFFAKVAADLARPGCRGYALLIVRPKAAGTYREARKAFRRWRAPFKHEPVEAGYKIKFVSPGAGGTEGAGAPSVP